MPTEEEICRFQRVRPIMNEILQRKGLVEVAEEKVHVTGLKGPLEEGWRQKVDAFADGLLRDPSPPDRQRSVSARMRRSTGSTRWSLSRPEASFERITSASDATSTSVPRMTRCTASRATSS